MTKYIEYNLINNIPILYPHNDNKSLKYNLCPRYTIADSDKLLRIFDKRVSEIEYSNVKFKYIKITLNKKFETLNNEIEALYCYIIFKNTALNGIKFNSFQDILMWLKNDVNNTYILVTTPILKYHNVYYSVANDNDISIIYHTETESDTDCIQRMIKHNCFTICDNANILISLYHNGYLYREEFFEASVLLEELKHFYYTPSIWIDLLNQHRILNACDFPILHLLSKPYMIDKRLLDNYLWNIFTNYNVYMLTIYKHDILFSTILSSTYPFLNTEILQFILSDKIVDRFWINKSNLLEDMQSLDSCSIVCPDFYGIMASFINDPSMWKLWKHNKSALLQSLCKNYNNKLLYVLSDLLVPLFRLYSVGYENINIKKRKVRQLWQDILGFMSARAPYVLQEFFELCITCKLKIRIPYVFLSDIYKISQIDFFQQKYLYFTHNENMTYKYISLYHILKTNEHLDSLYYFHQNVLQKRITCILLSIYRRFKMFINDCHESEYLVGHLLVSYLETHRYYLT